LGELELAPLLGDDSIEIGDALVRRLVALAELGDLHLAAFELELERAEPVEFTSNVAGSLAELFIRTTQGVALAGQPLDLEELGLQGLGELIVGVGGGLASGSGPVESGDAILE